MSYIGSTPTTQSFIAGTDYFNGTGSAVNFTLSRSVNSVNDIEVIVNNVEQIPSGYSVSGTTLTFSAAPSSGTSNVYVRYLSTTNLSVAPGQGTVGLAQLSATGTPDATTFLRGDNAWSVVEGIPAGSVIWYAANAAPTGFLKANGATVSRSTYASLFSAIGTTFGAGDGSTTFLVPDLRGEFLRGWDDGRGIDSGRAFGSAQGQAIQSHRHLLGLGRNDRPEVFLAGYESGAGGSRDMFSVFNGTYNYQGLTENTGGTETRPRNIALLACIKF